jgi:ABC-2 type transport system ATP-binding protein
MTPLELLRFFGEARELGRQRLEERLQAVTELCALHLVLEKPIGKLSRGLRQRVGLAQALLHDPEVLVMDEPTAGLDPNQIHEFRANLQQLRQQKKKTILLSTHILQEVEAVADRVLFVRNGRLVYDAPIGEVRSTGESLEALFYRLTGEETPSPAPSVASADEEVSS